MSLIKLGLEMLVGVSKIVFPSPDAQISENTNTNEKEIIINYDSLKAGTDYGLQSVLDYVQSLGIPTYSGWNKARNSFKKSYDLNGDDVSELRVVDNIDAMQRHIFTYDNKGGMISETVLTYDNTNRNTWGNNNFQNWWAAIYKDRVAKKGRTEVIRK